MILNRDDEFSEYTIDMIKADLDSLVLWKNLNATADTTKVNRIEKFKKCRI